MSTTEDRARAAMRAIAATVRDAPPLHLTPARDLAPAPGELRLDGEGPDHLDKYVRGLRRPGKATRPSSHGRAHRWRAWLAPLSAAAVVAALAVALVLVRDIPGGRVAAPSPSPTSASPTGRPAQFSADVPEYYVTWMQADKPYLIVGDTFSGKTIAVLKAPDGVFLKGVYGTAADDRTFIVTGSRLHGTGTAAWYLLRITPGSSIHARLTPLPIPVRQSPAGVAISPDGTKLAVALPGSPATLRVYSVATGTLLHTWSTTAAGELTAVKAPSGSWQYTASVLRWSPDGHQLAFTWNASAIRVLNASGPDGNLITRSKLLAAIGTTYTPAGVSITCNAWSGWALLAGGQSVVCAGSEQTGSPPGIIANGWTCPGGDHVSVGFVQETRSQGGGGSFGIGTAEPECPGKADLGTFDGAYIGWSNATGSVLIGSLLWDGHERFGIFRNNQFTPLPALPDSMGYPPASLLGTDAW